MLSMPGEFATVYNYNLLYLIVNLKKKLGENVHNSNRKYV